MKENEESIKIFWNILIFFSKEINLKVNNYSANVLKLPLYCISCYGVVAKPFLDGKYSVIWLYMACIPVLARWFFLLNNFCFSIFQNRGTTSFGYFAKVESKNHWFQLFWKRKRIIGFHKGTTVFWVVNWLFFLKIWELWLYISAELGNRFSGTMVMNLKNRSDNPGGLDVC